MNDRARFETLADLVLEPLQRYVGRRCAPADAADVIADTLLVLWRRLDDVPSGAELPWTYGVARRCISNTRRGDQRRSALAQRVSLLPVDAEAGDHVEHLVVRDQVATALATLSEIDAEVVRLWAWEGLEPREIATVVDLTANAVSIRLHRAKQRLAESLRDRGGQDPGDAGHTRSNPSDPPREEAR